MQTFRDALIFLVVILIVATVRVSPVPEVSLSPAQAGATAQNASPAPAAGEIGAAPAMPAGEAAPAEPEDPACDPSLTVKTSPAPDPAHGDNPCDA